MPPGRGDIHVVVADAAADDQPAALQPAKGALGQGKGVVEHERVGVLDAAAQVVLVAGL